jgi:RNase P subunit RPR2
MKILKLGKLADTAVHRFTCRECATVFEFERREAEYISDPRDGDCLKIDCPGCKRAAYVGVSAATYHGQG